MVFDFGRNNSSGRPIMRDVVVKGKSQETSYPKRSKEPSEIPIPVTKKAETAWPLSPPGLLFERKAASPYQAEKRTHGIYWLLGTAAILGVAWLLLTFFAYVEVAITPKQEFVEIDLPIRASAGISRDIGLEIITLEERTTSSFPITETRTVLEKASGLVMIYNAYSTQPQTLVAGTRLEAPDGKVYRITKTITVPGAKMENGKLNPSAAEVEALAVAAGEEYNIGLADFTIPGFKGTDRYPKFYARSKTEMKGGAAGTFTAVTEKDVEKAIENSKEYFAKIFNEKISANLPPGVLLPENSFRVTYSAARVEPPVNSKASEVSVEVLAVFEGLGLNEKDLEETIVNSYIALAPDETVEIENIGALTFEKLGEDFQNKAANFRVRGKAHLVWAFDEGVLKSELGDAIDKTKVFEKYPAVKRAEINFKPAWWRVFPKDLQRVKIKRILEPEG